MVAQRVSSHNSGKITRVISRAKERIHVFFEDQGQEWLFVRNPRDGRRVLGRLIDHKERVILDYPEADLVDNRVARGWVDVFTIGVSPDRLADLCSTGRRKEQGGIVFDQYVAKGCEECKTKFNEVWWSNEQALPLKIVSSEAHGGWIQKSVAIRLGVDENVLRDPEERYPAYATMDMVDWREEHHGSHSLDSDH